MLIEFQFSKSFSFEGDFRNATVAGTIVSYQGGLGYSMVHYDTKLTGYINVGYKTDINLPYVAPGIRVKKALTDNTYGMVGLELPIYFRREAMSPTYIVGAGFKF